MTNETFDRAVLAEIVRQRSYGARFPSPVGLRSSGEPTDAARRLGYPSDREVMESVRRLQRVGEVRFIWRHGYTWVIVPSQDHTPDEVVDGPQNVCNRPSYWDEI